MALVITANELDKQTGVDEDGVAQKPYQYRNYLKETITLPRDSEVAVQSVKFSRDQTSTIRDGDKWYQMYNINLEDLSDGRTSQDTTGYPIVCQLANAGEINNLPLNEIAVRITSQMRKGFPHPDVMYKVVDDTTPICKTEYNSAGNFAGLTFRQTNYTIAEALNTRSLLTNYSKLYQNGGQSLEYDKTTNVFTAPALPDDPGLDNIGQITDLPISHYKGNMRIDINKLFTDPTQVTGNVECDAAFGLTRAFERDAAQPILHTAPPYFFVSDSVPGHVTTHFDEGREQFFDYGIRIDTNNAGKRFLRVVCACSDEEADRGLYMKEIKYWDWTGNYPGAESVFDEMYDMEENDEDINQFLIRIDGERVNFYYHTGALSTSDNPLGDGGWTLFCGFDMSYGGAYWHTDGSNNENIPPPILQTQWMLYPQVYISDDRIDRSGLGGGPDEPGAIQITAYSGRDATEHQYYAPRNDWWARCMLNDAGSDPSMCNEVDTKRFKFSDPYRAQTSLTWYSQTGSTASRQMSGYCWAYCLTPDAQEYYVEATDSNVDRLFGFPDVPILQPASYGGGFDSTHGWKYDSLVVPEMISDQSLFIRLDNFTQKTLNGAVERPSKILYHIPRFDASARSHGDGLYMEPHERVYVKLNNPMPLTINEFDISICNVGEILATDLKGQTIIVLHFRENQTGTRQESFLKREKDEGVFTF